MVWIDQSIRDWSKQVQIHYAGFLKKFTRNTEWTEIMEKKSDRKVQPEKNAVRKIFVTIVHSTEH